MVQLRPLPFEWGTSMSKSGKNDSVGGVGSLRSSERVKSTENVEQVKGVESASSVSGVGRVGGSSPRRATRVMSLEEREKLFAMIEEEAEKLLGSAKIPASKRQLVTDAVKMAVDTGLMADSQAEGTKDDKKRGGK